MTYFDAHNHLQDEWLAPHLARVLETLEKMGIAGAVVNGTIDSDWESVARLGRERRWVIPSYGVHPWRSKERAANWEERLRERLDEGGVVGEIGLDRWKEGYDFVDQEMVFRAQLGLAAERNLPATIHCLRAWGALWEIIRMEAVPERGFLLHAYGGPVEMIEGFAGRGAYFSFNGSFLAEQRHRKREAFREIPLDRLLVETDAPAMPVPAELDRYPLPEAPEGETVNHPGNIEVAYEGLARLRGMEIEELERVVEANFRRLFGNAGKRGAAEKPRGRP
jgi:TatD DNase family protein